MATARKQPREREMSTFNAQKYTIDIWGGHEVQTSIVATADKGVASVDRETLRDMAVAAGVAIDDLDETVDAWADTLEAYCEACVSEWLGGLSIGDQIEAGAPGTDDYDTGKIEAIHDASQAWVAWDSGVKTLCPISDMRAL